MEQIKLCPDCGCEYTPAGQVCADCGTPLVWRRVGDATLAGAGDNPWAGLPPGMAGLLFEDGQAAIRDYAELLASRRIPSVQAPVVAPNEHGEPAPVWDGGAVGYRHGLYVPREDYELAERLVTEARHRRDPGLAENPYVDFPEEGCPACGSPLPENADECPDCGLPFAVE